MKYYCDGFMFRGNPSPIGGGYTIVDENGNVIKREAIYKKGMTNNEAELLGIFEASKLAQKGDIVSSDSMNCIGWVNRGKAKARPDLNPIIEQTHYNFYPTSLMEGRPKRAKAFLIWEPRELNLAGILNEKVPIKPEGIGSAESREYAMLENPVIKKEEAAMIKASMKHPSYTPDAKRREFQKLIEKKGLIKMPVYEPTKLERFYKWLF